MAKSSNSNGAVLQQLNKILSLEYAGVVQYMQHSFLVTGQDRLVFSGFFREQSASAHKHAGIIGDKIVALGGIPTVEPTTIHQSTDLTEMLNQDLQLERDALDAYLKAWELAKDNPTLKFMLEAIITEEQAHVEEMEKLVGKNKVAVSDKEITLQRAG